MDACCRDGHGVRVRAAYCSDGVARSTGTMDVIVGSASGGARYAPAEAKLLCLGELSQ